MQALCLAVFRCRLQLPMQLVRLTHGAAAVPVSRGQRQAGYGMHGAVLCPSSPAASIWAMQRTTWALRAPSIRRMSAVYRWHCHLTPWHRCTGPQAALALAQRLRNSAEL